jgi:SAM-dependent methyltransferase
MMPDALRRVRILESYLLNETGIFLDLGCGDCRVEESLNKYDIKFIGIDLNLNSLREAKSKGHNVICADARRLPFEDVCFDGVILTEVLEHVEEDDKVISEISRVLRSNASCIITVPNGQCSNVLPFQRLVNIMYRESAKRFGHVRSGYTIATLEGMFNRYSFKLVDYQYDLKLFGAFLTLIWYYLLSRQRSKIWGLLLCVSSRLIAAMKKLYNMDDIITKEGFTIFAKFKKVGSKYPKPNI